MLIVSSDGTFSTATLPRNNVAIAAQHAIQISNSSTELWSKKFGPFKPKILAMGEPLDIISTNKRAYGDINDFYKDAVNDWIILQIPMSGKNGEESKFDETVRIGEAKADDIIFIGGTVVPDSIDLSKPIPLTRLEFQKKTFRLSQGKVNSVHDNILIFERIAGDELIAGMSGGPIMKLDPQSSDLILVGIYLGTTARALIFERELGRTVHSLQKMLPN